MSFAQSLIATDLSEETIRCLSPDEVLNCFHGKMPRNRQSPLYTIGLLLVAVIMILLPLIYIAIICAVSWGILWHLQNDTGMIIGHSGVIILSLIGYLAPAVAGGTLVIFMVKPLFARHKSDRAWMPLFESDQPTLYAFIRRICELTGAPRPKVIEIDCNVNASASFKNGFWSLFMPGDLRLTLGMPLVAGLDLQQLAGVLAHEFGHFSQGAGMRLTFIVRSINAWFARVVHERDSWDDALWEWAHHDDWRVQLVFQLARGAVWLSRRILWVLMMIGHGVSSFMLRQMEFDADTFEIGLAGSAAFESTSNRLRELGLGNRVAMLGLKESYKARRMPDDFPTYLLSRASEVPAEVMAQIRADAAKEKTGWFDSHPSDAERVKAAKMLSQSGIFHAEAPAASVFREFSSLCKSCTAHHYAQILELPMDQLHLVDTSASTAEVRARSAALDLVQSKIGNAALSYLFPLPLAAPTPWTSWEALGESELTAWNEITIQREAASKALAEYAALDDKTDALDIAETFIKCAIQIKPADYGLDEATLENVLTERKRIDLAKETQAAVLRPFHEAITIALHAGFSKQMAYSGPRIESLLQVLNLLHQSSYPIHKAWSFARVMHALASNASEHSQPYTVNSYMRELARNIQVMIAPTRQQMDGLTYPYPHAKGQVTLTNYVFPTGDKKGDEIQLAFNNSQAMIENLSSLYVRVFCELCQIACDDKLSTEPSRTLHE